MFPFGSTYIQCSHLMPFHVGTLLVLSSWRAAGGWDKGGCASDRSQRERGINMAVQGLQALVVTSLTRAAVCRLSGSFQKKLQVEVKGVVDPEENLPGVYPASLETKKDAGTHLASIPFLTQNGRKGRVSVTILYSPEWC